MCNYDGKIDEQTINIDGVEMVIEYHYEQDARNPFKEWDNLSEVYHTARWMDFGEIHQSMGCILSSLVWDTPANTGSEKWDDFIYDLENDEDEAIGRAWKILDNYYIYQYKTLYMNRDCEKFLFITSKKNAAKAFLKKIVTKDVRERTRDCIKGEIETFQHYLEGEVYGYIAHLPDDHPDDLINPDDYNDSCWGYYGRDSVEESAKSEARYLAERYNDDMARAVEEKAREDERERIALHAAQTYAYA